METRPESSFGRAAVWLESERDEGRAIGSKRAREESRRKRKGLENHT